MMQQDLLISVLGICLFLFLAYWHGRVKETKSKFTELPKAKDSFVSRSTLLKRWLNYHELTAEQKVKLFLSWGLFPYTFYSDTLKKRFLVFAINRNNAASKIIKIGKGKIPFTVLECEFDECNRLPKQTIDLDALRLKEESEEEQKKLHENQLSEALQKQKELGIDIN